VQSGPPQIDPATGERVSSQPKHDFSTLTANPKGEGTYKISTQDGQTLDVPYSNVPVFTGGLAGTQFASPAEQARFEKDAAADPHRPTFWNALTNPVGSGGREQGAVGGALQVGGQAIKTMVQPFAHPIDTAKGIAKVASDAAIYGPGAAGADVVAPVVQQYAQDQQQGGNALALENLAGQVLGNVEGGRVMGAAVSGVKPSAALGAAGEAPVAGAEGPVNTMSPVNRMIPEAVRNGVLPSAWDWVNNKPLDAARRFVAGDVNAPMPGTDMTPAARYQSMKDMGLQPNASEATNSTPLNIAEKVNQNSLTAAPIYAKARSANLAALTEYTKDLLDSMGPEAEEGGAAVQQGLRAAQKGLQEQAASGFKDLDEAMGSRKLSGMTVQQTAKNIYDSYKDYASQHPALVPKEAWKIVRDLAGEDNNFQSRPMSFPEVHQIRSDLLEMVRTNPDIVKNQAGGWLQQLADAADRTMTSGATGLNPEGTRIFRDANQAWADMKGTYDNPSHPFYQAVRTTSPSTLVNGISRTPEMAKTLQEALGPEGIGPIQRGVAEKALGTTKEGGYNFKTFQGQWNKLPQAYRDALFTPEQAQHLEDIGNAGTVLHEDANPSGSARLGQGIAEGAAALRSVTSPHELVGNAAYHAAQYGVGRLMNSPRFVDWLMKGRGFSPIAEVAPTAPAAVAGATSAVGPDGQPNFYSDAYLRAKAALDAARAKEQ
jgi:hypothetical protein